MLPIHLVIIGIFLTFVVAGFEEGEKSKLMKGWETSSGLWPIMEKGGALVLS